VNTKSNVTISLNAELTNLAKDLGLNISNTCENALKLAISRLQGTNAEITDALPQFGANFSVVDRAGFEPAASALRTRGQHLGIYIWRRQIFQEQI
jgi:post-segregation antitoxin (ccd killing protein)